MLKIFKCIHHTTNKTVRIALDPQYISFVEEIDKNNSYVVYNGSTFHIKENIHKLTNYKNQGDLGIIQEN